MEALASISIDTWPIAAVCVFVLLDIGSGFVKAYVTGTLSSKEMRDGLMHKSAYFALIALFACLEVFQRHFELLPNVPTTLAVCIYVCATEFFSVLENIVTINPDIKKWPIITQLFDRKG